MGLFKSYNDVRALNRGAKSTTRRVAYRGAMRVYAGGRRRSKTEALTSNEQATFAILVLVSLVLAVLLVVWLV